MTTQTQNQNENQTENLTQGVHHIGLTVKDLPTTLRFFEKVLKFDKIGEVPDYPAAFVTDGKMMIALWQVKSETIVEFDRHANVGLHHLAFIIDGEEKLNQLHDKLNSSDGVIVEFAPEPLTGMPAKHMMITEPGGIRIEFITTV